jgi:hypothetical protein
MHGGREHDHSYGGGGPLETSPAGVGHNWPSDARQPAQWQVPHRDDAPAGTDHQHAETDLDLVEGAFIEGFVAATDATSFPRLAKVPFETTAADGTKLALLRVEIDTVADVGSITPHLGGASFRYDPLPARMVSRRTRLRFIYFDWQKLRALDLAEATTHVTS